MACCEIEYHCPLWEQGGAGCAAPGYCNNCPERSTMSFKTGDRVRLNDPYAAGLYGVEGTIDRYNDATDEWVVKIVPTEETIAEFNAYPENATNGAKPDEVYFYEHEMEALAA